MRPPSPLAARAGTVAGFVQTGRMGNTLDRTDRSQYRVLSAAPAGAAESGTERPQGAAAGIIESDFDRTEPDLPDRFLDLDPAGGLAAQRLTEKVFSALELHAAVMAHAPPLPVPGIFRFGNLPRIPPLGSAVSGPRGGH